MKHFCSSTFEFELRCVPTYSEMFIPNPMDVILTRDSSSRFDRGLGKCSRQIFTR